MNVIKRLTYKICKRYIQWADGFSYDFGSNGEKWVVEQLSTMGLKTVFDVGANVGEWTNIALGKFQGATVHSFELSPSTFENLKKNVADEHRSKLNNFGMSNVNERVQYKDYGENSGVNTILPNVDFHDDSIVPSLKSSSVRKGDDYCKEHQIDQIDFLKMDVEGAEHLVLDGFSEMLGGGKIWVVQFEYGYTHGDAKFLMRDFFELFESYGYSVGLVRHGGVKLDKWHYALNDFNSRPKYIAVRAHDQQIIDAISAK
jgi:FkbM family methyltransferase